MPIHRGYEKGKAFYQWGSGKKYYYTPNDKRSRDNAYNLALKQSIAARAHGWRGK